MFDKIRYTLLQIRNPNDPMRGHEVQTFARVLDTSPAMIRVCDLLSDEPSSRLLAETDMFLLGGSGHYSAAGDGEWLHRALQFLQDIHGAGKPAFASCWGFQAMARAMGGRVISDPDRAELGTLQLHLTDAGREDPVFGPLGQTFFGQMGHEDRVVDLPPGATLLAFSDRVTNQAYRFDGLPIYCTQFHPELNSNDVMARVNTYPEYVEQIVGVSLDEFAERLHDTPDTQALLPRLVTMIFGN